MESPSQSFTDNTESSLCAKPTLFTPRTLSTVLGPGIHPVSRTRNGPHSGYEGIPHTCKGHDRKINTHDVLGQFSYAPATQTTVVTTTTTTTTSFPPLVVKAPNHLHDLDRMSYPLAALPTPAVLRRLKFDVGGRSTIFQETTDAADALQKFHQEQDRLKDFPGSLRSITRLTSSLETPPAQLSRAASTGAKGEHRAPSRNETFLPRPKSPISISEAAQIACCHNKRRRTSSHSVLSVEYEDPSKKHTASARTPFGQTSTPLTPFATTGLSDLPQAHSETPPYRHNSHPQGNNEAPHAAEGEYITNSTLERPDSLTPAESMVSNETTSITSDSLSNHGSGLGLMSSFSRARPSILDTTAAQDMSLPSPSLSPVTAAANLQIRRSYFEESTAQRAARPSALSSPPDEGTDEDGILGGSPSDVGGWDDQVCCPRGFAAVETTGPNNPSAEHTMMDIPIMLDSFEAMPAEMKSYVMYQLLRRCPKPVLHMIAETVNPALKCDFLGLLPLELCQNIISHLDVKSLCRAAQVSKKWRQVTDTDEKTWKRLFDSEGFVMPPGELQRALLEGWGWQHAPLGDVGDKDVRESGKLVSPETQFTSFILGDPANVDSSPELLTQIAQVKRLKRKAPPKSKPSSRKQQKKKESDSAAVAEFDKEAMMKVSETDGPYAIAKAAATVVPDTQNGLPSLRHLHLYKSIYRRHHLISSNWMQDEVKPRHLAFKAHQRHVVTCLQFDTDKIITGSDDTNINVYDTKTGALRARLEGHEGGVWALQYEGNVLVSGSTDRSVRVWDIKRGVCTHVFQGHTSTVRCLVILMPVVVDTTSDGQPVLMPKEPLIITGSRDSNLRVWKLPKDGDPSFMQAGPSQDETDCPYFVRALTGHHHSVRAIAAHGDTLVSGSYDFNVRVWKISTGATVHRLQGHAQKVYSVVLDHERNRCISGSMDNLVKVWSLDTGTVLYNLEGHSSLVGLLDLQRGRLVSAAADSTLRVWDPETGHCKSVLSAHTGAITCFQHDGQKVISGSDRTLKMWNVKTGEFVRDLLTDLSGVWQVKFDERRCVAAVQRNNLTYIEVLDFGASQDGVPEMKRGKRTVVDIDGSEVNETHEQSENAIDLDGADD